MNRQMPFAGNPLDRAEHQRHDEAWVEEQLQAPKSRFMAFSQLKALALIAERPVLLWLDNRAFASFNLPTKPVFLGLQDGAAHFAVDLTDVPNPLVAMGLAEADFMEVRGLATTLHHTEAGIVAQARSLLDWHKRHRYCSVCGQETEPKRGGSMRKCPACNTEHFPRTDPVVISVVWRDDRCLLGRRAGRPEGNFSTIAGFIDQGETIEDAVRREVEEEVGVKVDEVQYRASQPWPFPSSLMIGCFAHAASDDFHADEDEIAEARWFTREEVRQALYDGSPELMLPGPAAIAYHLVADWYETRPGQTV